MPRIARIVIPGCSHHPPSPAGYGVTSVTQRGNNRQDHLIAIPAGEASLFPYFPGKDKGKERAFKPGHCLWFLTCREDGV
jgi:hypothetical protein